MNNACIVLQKKINPSENGVAAVLGVFLANGYSFMDARFILQSDEKRVQECIQSLKESADTLLLLADKTALPIVKGYISAYYNENTAQNIFGGAGIYRDKKSTLFVLSADETDTGVGYAKNVCVPYLQQSSGIRLDKMIIRAVGANEARVKGLLAQAVNISGNKLSCYHTRKYDEDVIEIAYDSNTPRIKPTAVYLVMLGATFCRSGIAESTTSMVAPSTISATRWGSTLAIPLAIFCAFSTILSSGTRMDRI